MSSNSYFGGMAFNLSRAFILAAMFLTSIAQNEALSQYALDYGFTMGTANYLGDIGGDQLTRRDFAADLHLGQTKLSTHIFVRYRLSSAVAIKAQMGTVYLEDYDNLSSNLSRRTRNAHFRNSVNELSLRGEINLFSQPMLTRYTSKYRVGVNAYATLGVTAFVHNPQAQLDRDAAEYHYNQGNIDTNPSLFNYDHWYDLRDHRTEQLTYGSAALGFPLGFGASFMVNNKVRLGIEFVWNLTLTDYLDDVSFTYADPEGLDDIGLVLSQPSSVVVAETAGAENPEVYLNNFGWDAAYASPRGNPDKNDTYGTLQVAVSRVVMGSSNFRKKNSYRKRRPIKRRSRKPGSRRVGRGRAKF
tara:strand:+ start:1170 stop:2243 length:1074 start_codon:yes stop_codon:yes gene_type:complete